MTAKLTDIDGIGPAAAKALAAAGITTVAQLAEVDASKTDAVPALDGYRGAPAWPEWTSGAKALVAKEQKAVAPGGDREAGADGAAGGQHTPVSQSGEQSPAASPQDGGGPALVVTGPERGFWRAGVHFGGSPKRLVQADFADGIEGGRRFLAIVAEPNLQVVFVTADGNEISPTEEDRAQARELLDTSSVNDVEAFYEATFGG